MSSVMAPGAGYDEYSLLNLYSGFFWLLVPYSENSLLDRVASNSNKSSDGPLLDANNTFYGSLAFNIVSSWSKQQKG